MLNIRYTYDLVLFVNMPHFEYKFYKKKVNCQLSDSGHMYSLLYAGMPEFRGSADFRVFFFLLFLGHFCESSKSKEKNIFHWGVGVADDHIVKTPLKMPLIRLGVRKAGKQSSIDKY